MTQIFFRKKSKALKVAKELRKKGCRARVKKLSKSFLEDRRTTAKYRLQSYCK